MESVIYLEDTPWEDIEESIAALSSRDPTLIMSDDIVKRMTILLLEIQWLIAEYAAACGPFDEERSEIFQLRCYAMYKCGRLRSARFGVYSLRYGAIRGTDGFWLTKLSMDCYYSGNIDDAFNGWICASALSDGAFVPSVNGAFAHAMTGHFQLSLDQVDAYRAVSANHRLWKSFVRAMALAGLRKYGESLNELSTCLKAPANRELLSEALELKSAVESRLSMTGDISEPLDWILEAHQKAVASRPKILFRSDQYFPVPDTIKIPAVK